MPEPRKSLMRITSLLVFTRGVGWGLGFIREVTIAALFGASRIVDTFTIAVLLPNAIFNLLANTLSSALIPHFMAVKAARGETDAQKSLKSISFQIVFAVTAITALGGYFAPEIVSIIAPGFATEEFEQTVRFLRIVLLGCVGTTIFILLHNVYQIHDRWLLPALGPVITNIIAIVILLSAGNFFGRDVIAWSWLLSFTMLPIVLLVGKTGRNFIAPVLTSESNRKFYAIAVPIAMASLFGTVVQLVNRYIASGLPAGELSSLAYSQRIYNMCCELVLATFVPALFPRLAESATHSSPKEYGQLLEKSLLGITLVTMMGTAMLGGVALPLIEVAFERGAFMAADSERVAAILSAFSIALLFFVPTVLLYRAYYAIHKAWVPTIAMLISMVLDIVLCFLLISPLGTPGMAVASAAGLGFQVIYLSVTAKRYGILLPLRQFTLLFLKGIPVVVMVALAVRFLDGWLRSWWIVTDVLWRIPRLLGLIVIVVLLFATLSKLFRLPGLELIIDYLTTVWNRVRKKEPRHDASA